jgi:hypothetical protein
MTVFGYARVSTDSQSLSAQLAELKAAKCAKIFQEKISGARSDRKQLKPGDEGFRPRLTARLRHRSPPHSSGIIHCPAEVGTADVWCTGESLSETVRISQWRVCPICKGRLK